MATFSITPVTDFPAPDADAFPNYIQFQADGVDLGLPDVDTVNFTGGSPTRGTGESSNVLTVPLGGGGAGNGPLWLRVTGTHVGNDVQSSQLTSVVDGGGSAPGVAAVGAGLEFADAGVYEVRIRYSASVSNSDYFLGSGIAGVVLFDGNVTAPRTQNSFAAQQFSDDVDMLSFADAIVLTPSAGDVYTAYAFSKGPEPNRTVTFVVDLFVTLVEPAA